MSPPGLHVNLTGQRMSGWGEPVRRCVRRMRITPRAAVLGYPQKLKFLRRSVTGTSMNRLGRGYVGWNPPQVQRGGCLGGEAPSLTPSLRCFLIFGGGAEISGEFPNVLDLTMTSVQPQLVVPAEVVWLFPSGFCHYLELVPNHQV